MYPQLEQWQQERIVQEVTNSLVVETAGRGKPELKPAALSPEPC
jgi:hypothetical protein